MMKIQTHLLKILSFIIAIFVWIYVINSAPVEVEREVALEVILPEGISLRELPPKFIKLKLKGPKAFISNIYSGREKVFLNLGAEVDNFDIPYEYSIKEKDLILPFGVVLRSVTPKNVFLNFSKKEVKRVPIKLNIIGKLSTDYKLLSSSVEPAFIEIKAAREHLDQIKEVSTKAINISTMIDSSSREIELESLDQRFELALGKVTANLNIKAKAANLTLKKIPIVFMSTNQNFKSSERFASLSVLSDEKQVSNIGQKDVKVIAEIQNKKGSQKIKLQAILPDGVHLVKIHPEVIQITIR